MNARVCKTFKSVSLLALAAIWVAAAAAQTSAVKEKPPMYSYIGDWAIPRAQWGDMEKARDANQKTMEKALANGTIVGYGDDVNLVHQAEGPTHDEWWSAMSMAGILNILDQFYKSGSSTTPVLAAATKHWDSIYVSEFYNWHAGSWKDVYTHGSSYKLKASAPADALETLSKNLVVPLLEKMLAEGAIHEYEIDTEAIHTESPSSFWIFYIAANAEGLDKVNSALRDTMKANPLGGPAFDSMVDMRDHRDLLVRTNATYK